MEIPKNIKIELPYNPAISLLGLSKENEHSGSKRYMQKKKKKIYAPLFSLQHYLP